MTILQIIVMQLITFITVSSILRNYEEPIKDWNGGDWFVHIIISFIFPFGIIICIFYIIDKCVKNGKTLKLLVKYLTKERHFK